MRRKRRLGKFVTASRDLPTILEIAAGEKNGLHDRNLAFFDIGKLGTRGTLYRSCIGLIGFLFYYFQASVMRPLPNLPLSSTWPKHLAGGQFKCEYVRS